MKPHEISEIALLGVRAYIQQGNYAEALVFMSNTKHKIVDTV